MSIIKCRECGNDVSDKAASCPQCGAPVKKPTWWTPLKRFAAFMLTILVLAAILKPADNKINPNMGEAATTSINDAKQEAAETYKQKEAKTIVDSVIEDRDNVDYNKPLYSSQIGDMGTVVCPTSILFDDRVNHGTKAALDAATAFFGREKKIEDAGCKEIHSGRLFKFSNAEIKNMKEMKSNHKVGFAESESGELVFSGDLINKCIVNGEEVEIAEKMNLEAMLRDPPASGSTPKPQETTVSQPKEFPQPSWCTKATTPAEKMVCQDSGLSASAITLETRWGEYKATHTPAEIAPIKETLRGWNKNVLQVCSTVECATDAYQKLLKSLF